MKVALINTYLKGGAGIACQRLSEALRKNNVEAQTLTQDEIENSPYIFSITKNAFNKLGNKIRLTKELLPLIPRLKSREDLFKFSIGKEGVDITDNPLVRNADIIHLHWINQGFLSIENIHQLKKLNKPLVWTLHDMWAFTGGCHYSKGCLAYENECNYCPYLKNASATDLSNRVWKKKKSLFKDLDITFVACSDWLKETALRSRLLKEAKVVSIPNPIDHEAFKAIDAKTARVRLNLSENSKVILFGAMNVEDKRKGFSYLLNALNILAEKFPETGNEIELAVFGELKNTSTITLPFQVKNLGLLRSKEAIINAYSAANVYVIPSLEDNLPNTVMESLSCSTPVAGFNTGGIPEMIDHNRNGYIAAFKSAEDLANGIHHLLYKAEEKALREESRKKVVNYYSEKIVAEKYTKLYTEILKK